jgi:flavin-dependent dehydrogenase
MTYSVSRWSGEGWVLVGDAAGAGDPLFGSGAMLALTSGEWAAQAVIEGFRANDLSAAQLGRWIERYSGGVQKIRRLARCFLSPKFSCGQLVSLHPEHKARLTGLLMGSLFDENGALLPVDAESWFRFSSADEPSRERGGGPHVALDMNSLRIGE